MSIIKAVDVIRDECGMWTHPDFPHWDEGVDISVMNKWFGDNDGTWFIETLEDCNQDDLVDDWFEQGNFNCSKWKPKCSKSGSFLLSIHDTDDGPIAAFFVPNGS